MPSRDLQRRCCRNRPWLIVDMHVWDITRPCHRMTRRQRAACHPVSPSLANHSRVPQRRPGRIKIRHDIKVNIGERRPVDHCSHETTERQSRSEVRELCRTDRRRPRRPGGDPNTRPTMRHRVRQHRPRDIERANLARENRSVGRVADRGVRHVDRGPGALHVDPELRPTHLSIIQTDSATLFDNDSLPTVRGRQRSRSIPSKIPANRVISRRRHHNRRPHTPSQHQRPKHLQRR